MKSDSHSAFGRGCVELPVYPVERTGDGRIADGGADLAAAHGSLQAHLPHQPGHRAAGDVDALATELPPHLAHAIDAEVRLEHSLDVRDQDQVALGSATTAGKGRRAGPLCAR